MLIDLHAQTGATAGGSADPGRVITAAQKAGLGGVAFVDRLHSSHANQVIAAGEEAGFPVFVGVEIPAAVGRLLCFTPQVDPFLTREEWRQLMALPFAPTAARIISLFNEMGGAVVAAQPYEREDGIRLGDGLVLIDGLAGVEVLTPQHSRQDCKLAIELSIKSGLPLAAGSAGSQHVGRFATLFSGGIETQADFVEALRSGNFWAVELGGEGHGPSERRPRGGRRSERGGGRGGDRSGGRQKRRGRRRGRSQGNRND